MLVILSAVTLLLGAGYLFEPYAVWTYVCSWLKRAEMDCSDLISGTPRFYPLNSSDIVFLLRWIISNIFTVLSLNLRYRTHFIRNHTTLLSLCVPLIFLTYNLLNAFLRSNHIELVNMLCGLFRNTNMISTDCKTLFIA